MATETLTIEVKVDLDEDHGKVQLLRSLSVQAWTTPDAILSLRSSMRST